MSNSIRILLVLTIMSSGCGLRDQNARTCTVSRKAEGAVVSCPNVDAITIQDGLPGVQGPKGDSGATGLPGANGADGKSMVQSIVHTAPGCSNGGITILLATDADGDGVLTPADTNLQSAEVCNGVDGASGTNGQDGHDAPPTPFTPVGLVDPCGDSPGVQDEVFMRLSNGTLLASFSDTSSGQNTRFSVLTPGSYVTTDGSNCYFTVDGNNAIINESFHN